MSRATLCASRCRLHHKDTNFKANHNPNRLQDWETTDVDCTTKIRILKQITTDYVIGYLHP